MIVDFNFNLVHLYRKFQVFITVPVKSSDQSKLSQNTFAVGSVSHLVISTTKLLHICK